MINRYLGSMLLALSAAHSGGLLAEPVPASGILEATGVGTVDASMAKSKIQARMLAKRAAKVDAQRNLLEVIEGVRVTAGTTVKDAQLESDLIANRVKGMLKGAFVLSESVEEMEDSYYAEVQLGICLDGSDPRCNRQPTLSQAVYAGLSQTPSAQRYTTDLPAGAAAETTTGLIVDLTGTGFSRYLDVRIRSADGREVYGPGHFDARSGGDWLHWAESLDEARGMSEVVGDLPLVVTAAEIRDATDVMLSEETAATIYRTNAQNEDFLARGSVILVIN